MPGLNSVNGRETKTQCDGKTYDSEEMNDAVEIGFCFVQKSHDDQQHGETREMNDKLDEINFSSAYALLLFHVGCWHVDHFNWLLLCVNEQSAE